MSQARHEKIYMRKSHVSHTRKSHMRKSHLLGWFLFDGPSKSHKTQVCGAEACAEQASGPPVGIRTAFRPPEPALSPSWHPPASEAPTPALDVRDKRRRRRSREGAERGREHKACKGSCKIVQVKYDDQGGLGMLSITEKLKNTHPRHS